jgi:hypothetical protein
MLHFHMHNACGLFSIIISFPVHKMSTFCFVLFWVFVLGETESTNKGAKLKETWYLYLLTVTNDFDLPLLLRLLLIL